MKRYTTSNKNFKSDIDKIEAVTTCVGFDDILDETLPLNYPHLNTMIVITSHDDKKTKMVAQKHGAICVETDLFKKNGRKFNKGAAINAGFDRFQYYGWRMHIDSDIILPDNFRRLLLPSESNLFLIKKADLSLLFISVDYLIISKLRGICFY